jgi:hypothetical protein
MRRVWMSEMMNRRILSTSQPKSASVTGRRREARMISERAKSHVEKSLRLQWW